MHSLLVIYNSKTKTEPIADSLQCISPEFILRSSGYLVDVSYSEKEALTGIKEADASILHVPVSEIKEWGSLLMKQKTAPVIWWCTDETANLSLAACEDHIMVDGILGPSMQPQEIHWSLHFSAKQCFERQQWLKEREQLLSKIEERKWIDMAKGILSKVKNISESEAYDLLRKQAMNERKRMVDVATSIVKVYQLLQDQTQGGSKS
ncbi:ANTAR domain-containing response regulator [Paenibacillus wynnii]|uniref:Histidine kinase n=1 Tax=Paenibacillus wynnii TaxID=268407 RepID=A0A098M343_9BACL|nr:ANTAR domain-containing protein [Paenibacillus wynnii]KGE16910.1 histidine kinase [Paenibacillus wynnii]